MKRSAIYRKAAYLLESNKSTYDWSCWVICEAMGANYYNIDDAKPFEVEAYEHLFSPELPYADKMQRHCWGRYWEDPERRDCRILALCFMAAIAEDEERSGGKL